MKKTTHAPRRSLRLNRESLLHLTDATLVQIVGGGSTRSQVFCQNNGQRPCQQN